MTLRQGQRTVAVFSIEFRTLASLSIWNPAALVNAFLHGLADYMKDALLAYETPQTLDEVIEPATRVNLRVQVRQRERCRGA